MTVDIDVSFSGASSDQKWPDQQFTRSVVQALDTLTRYAHIQPYRSREDPGDIEHATFRKVFDPFLVFPFTTSTNGQPREWSSIDDTLISERVDRGNCDFTALQSLKYRLKDYPEAVEALGVLEQISLREKEWKDSVRASTTPEQSHQMFIEIRRRLDERDYVSVPHSEADKSPQAQLARLRVIGVKKFGDGQGLDTIVPRP